MPRPALVTGDEKFLFLLLRLSVALTAVGLHASQTQATESGCPSLLVPASSSAKVLSVLASWLHRAQRPAPGHLCHLFGSPPLNGSATSSSCAHTGVLCSPRWVCLLCSIPHDNKAGLWGLWATIPYRVTWFPGLCLLLPQLPPPPMLGLSCHVRPAWSGCFVTCLKQNGKEEGALEEAAGSPVHLWAYFWRKDDLSHLWN